MIAALFLAAALSAPPKVAPLRPGEVRFISGDLEGPGPILRVHGPVNSPEIVNTQLSCPAPQPVYLHGGRSSRISPLVPRDRGRR